MKELTRCAFILHSYYFVTIVTCTCRGRISETYGEDPYHIQQMGVTVMQGLQNPQPVPGSSDPEDRWMATRQVTRHYIGTSICVCMLYVRVCVRVLYTSTSKYATFEIDFGTADATY